MKRILITGAGGFIAHHLIKKISQYKKVKLVGIYKKKIKNKIILKNKIYYKKNNLSNINSLSKILNNKDTVIHLAGKSNIYDSSINRKQTFTQNILTTINLIEACLKKKVNKLIILSSIEVYRRRKSVYATSKILSDKIAKSYDGIDKNLKIIIIRSSNIYGEGQSKKNLVPKMILSMLNDKYVFVGNTQKLKKSYIYVEDLVKIIIHIFKYTNNSTTINLYNSNQVYSPLGLAHKIYKSFNIKKKIKKADDIFLKDIDNKLKFENNFLQKLSLKDFKFTDIEKVLPKLISYYDKK